MRLPMLRRYRYPSRRDNDTLNLFRREMDRTFDNFFEEFFSPASERSTASGRFTPRIAVKDTDGEIVVDAELPGMSRDDINVEIDQDRLIITGERKETKGSDEEGAQWSEIVYGSFHREIPLPTTVEMETSKALFRDGMLEVHLPKTESEKTRRRPIEIGTE